MLIKFSSNAAGSFTTFGEVAQALTRAMTGTGSQEGAIRGGNIDGALASLRMRVQRQDTRNDSATADTGDDDGEEVVDLSVRAVPLIEMLEAASAKARAGDPDTYVMWHPE
jgi:hypothetical protein